MWKESEKGTKGQWSGHVGAGKGGPRWVRAQGDLSASGLNRRNRSDEALEMFPRLVQSFMAVPRLEATLSISTRGTFPSWSE